MANMAREKVTINKNMSYNQLEKILLSNKVTPKKKLKIQKWLKEKQKEMDKNWNTWNNLFSESNELFRLAKTQLFREGNPCVKCVHTRGIIKDSTGKEVDIMLHQDHFNQLQFNLDDYSPEEIQSLALAKERELEEGYFLMRARPNYGEE
jgi:hypothetical protein